MLARTALSSLALLLLAGLAGCDQTDYTYVDPDPIAGSGGGMGIAGALSTGGVTLGLAGTSTITFTPPCQLVDKPPYVFAGRGVSHQTPARRELFTWTTTEQVAELRAGGVLMTRTEREGFGPGYAMEALATLALVTPPADSVLAAQVELAGLLSGPDFSKARYAWSEPWATRVGWPGESYGDQLVRMLLREDAWLAVYNGSLSVVDMNNEPVPVTDALAQPERLAGVYFIRSANIGGPECGGSFRSGGEGYREFIIGNEAMVEEWSLGTPEIRARIEADRALVEDFFQRVRPCPPGDDPYRWNLNVCCSWRGEGVLGEIGAYENALAIPSPNYLPQAAQLAALLEALQESLFEPDPFVVTPGQ